MPGGGAYDTVTSETWRSSALAQRIAQALIDQCGFARSWIGRSWSAVRTGLDLVDDRDPGALTSRVPDRVVGVDGAPEIEDPEQQQDEDREDQGELDEALASLPGGGDATDHGPTVMTAVAHSCKDPFG